ncbi:MAG: hypothetical protein ACK5NF_05675 [Bacilli bacterium]
MSDLKQLLTIVNKLNISKVDLANYLEVSRQMLYKYFSMDSFDDWPIKKKIKLLDLFNIKTFDEISNLEVGSDLYNSISKKLNKNGKSTYLDSYKSMSPEDQRLVNDVIRLCEDSNTKEYVSILLTLIEQSMVSKDYYFLIQYLSKSFNRISPLDFGSDPQSQKAFEGILFSAFNLFNSNKYSKEKTERVHQQFVKELEKKNSLDSKLSDSINITKMLAKNELGIDEIDESNIDLLLEKIIEIRGRKL